jgi:superfamily II DNA helicase RecQ
VLDGAPVRANVALTIRHVRGEARRHALIDAVRNLPRPLLVLCSRPTDVEGVYGALRAMNLAAHRYHEELAGGERAGEQLKFSMPGEKRILVATSAFGPESFGQRTEAEGVPLRYGRRVAKTDVRALVRFGPPASVEQLASELSLVGKDGHPAEALVFYDPSDRPSLEGELEAARPSAEQLLAFGRGLETVAAGSAITTEALAFAAQKSLRGTEAVATMLDRMGLVSSRGGWVRLRAPEATLLAELRAVAECYSTVRALDGQRIADVGALAAHGGCRSARLRALLGDSRTDPCGACAVCADRGDRPEDSPGNGRHQPVRRFTVTPQGVEETRTFHSGMRRKTVLTAKIGEFR